MFKKLYGKNIKPSCEYCIHGSFSSDGSMILCKKKGVVEIRYTCKRFIYDPIKRIPLKPLEIPEFSKEDFLI
jgi:hypothetical protein